MRQKRNFVVLGGAGTIGRVVARDLFESHPENRILVADYNELAARALAASLGGSRAKSAFVDARRPAALASLLKKHDVVINCLQHTFNLKVMEAALAAGVHYVDLGGLFTWTRRQLKLNQRFRDVKLTAVIGMGCAPGITNLLVAYADTFLEKMRSIKIRVGTIDFKARDEDGLQFTYSAQTIVEELTLKPWIWNTGKFRQTKPRTGWELTPFPGPVGKAWTIRTRHSEVATLPLSFAKKGVQFCDFKVGFDRKFVKEVMERLRRRWTIGQFNFLLAPTKDPDDYEIIRVIIDDIIIDCHAKAKPEWQASAGDMDTACPASIVAQMIAKGVVDRRGVSPPEIAVPCRPFFTELEKRGMEIKTSLKPD